MITYRLLAVTAVSAFVAVPVATGVDGAPLPNRDGVVVAWQARSSTAVVVTGDQRVYAIHALRRVAPGSRVRVEGVKWGTPTSGIKWTVAPSGIKWGITRAANGSFKSRLTVRPGRATTMALRATVVRRFGQRGVVVSVPGSTVVIPLRGAVWLPGGKRNNAAGDTLGAPGAAVTVRLAIDARGRVTGNRVVENAPPAPLPAIPLAGRVIAVDATARTLTVQAGTASFPIRLVVSLPPLADPALYPVGSEIAATVVPAAAPDTTIAATALSLNRTFAQADSPTTTVVVPAPNPAHVAAADALRQRWIAGEAEGLVPNVGTFTAERNRLTRIGFLIAIGDLPKAIKELEQLDKGLQNERPELIASAFRDEILATAAALKSQLLTP